MPIDTTALEKAIKRAIPVTHLEIQDQSSGCGESYAIVLVSEVGSDNKLSTVMLT
jgi:stress-induced morphogen